MFKWFWTIFSLGAPDIITENFSRNSCKYSVYVTGQHYIPVNIVKPTLLREWVACALSEWAIKWKRLNEWVSNLIEWYEGMFME